MRLEGLRPAAESCPLAAYPLQRTSRSLFRRTSAGGRPLRSCGDPLGDLGEPRRDQPQLDGTILEQPGRRLAGGDGVEQGLAPLPGAGQPRGDRGLQPPGRAGEAPSIQPAPRVGSGGRARWPLARGATRRPRHRETPAESSAASGATLARLIIAAAHCSSGAWVDLTVDCNVSRGSATGRVRPSRSPPGRLPPRERRRALGKGRRGLVSSALSSAPRSWSPWSIALSIARRSAELNPPVANDHQERQLIRLSAWRAMNRR